ncbi:zinc metalloprotease HtpX [Billgrantia kenyensis]|uniref:M48 family metalloprotease n=1 Tax=Billgrantia kenyensis TaxID=321266 RepID=A0A7V9W2Y7_9GAMM|nr:zinc metalloprotease HtpX [Halomonas kenyensis]MBA2779982.1 M48 family metalloprotease [Halomonas kenyensis]MCG6663003.1 M48 family metalloprotease [Halomonas kenyensis]
MSHLTRSIGLARLKNTLQTLLIVASLALVLALPGYLLTGIPGVLVSLIVVAIVVQITGWVPARLVLASSGAGLLRRHQAPTLYQALDVLYQRAGLEQPPQLYYTPSPELNAFTVGGPREGGIALTEGLVRTLDLAQLVGVLAHEVSHLRHGDTRVMSMAAAMTRLTLWLALLLQISLLVMLPSLVAEGEPLPWLALLAAACAPTLSSLLQLALSRRREYSADLEAVALTGDPYALASALTVLERHHGAWLMTMFGRRPPAWLDWLRTHPPTRERIRRLLALVKGSHVSVSPTHRDDAARPVILERPGPLGRRYWIVRRR